MHGGQNLHYTNNTHYIHEHNTTLVLHSPWKHYMKWQLHITQHYTSLRSQPCLWRGGREGSHRQAWREGERVSTSKGGKGGRGCCGSPYYHIVTAPFRMTPDGWHYTVVSCVQMQHNTLNVLSMKSHLFLYKFYWPCAEGRLLWRKLWLNKPFITTFNL